MVHWMQSCSIISFTRTELKLCRLDWVKWIVFRKRASKLLQGHHLCYSLFLGSAGGLKMKICIHLLGEEQEQEAEV